MMTSWNNTREIETYLLGTMPAADRILFQARLILQPKLRQAVSVQRNCYKLIQLHGRRDLKRSLHSLTIRFENENENLIEAIKQNFTRQ